MKQRQNNCKEGYVKKTTVERGALLEEIKRCRLCMSLKNTVDICHCEVDNQPVIVDQLIHRHQLYPWKAAASSTSECSKR